MLSIAILENYDNVKAVRISFFNVIGMVILFTIVYLLFNIYFVLQPLFNSLVWATIFGVFLFPLKNTFSNFLHDIIQNPKYKNKSLLIDILLLPWLLIGSFLDFFINILNRNKSKTLILSIGASLLRVGNFKIVLKNFEIIKYYKNIQLNNIENGKINIKNCILVFILIFIGLINIKMAWNYIIKCVKNIIILYNKINKYFMYIFCLITNYIFLNNNFWILLMVIFIIIYDKIYRIKILELNNNNELTNFSNKENVSTPISNPALNIYNYNLNNKRKSQHNLFQESTIVSNRSKIIDENLFNKSYLSYETNDDNLLNISYSFLKLKAGDDSKNLNQNYYNIKNDKISKFKRFSSIVNFKCDNKFQQLDDKNSDFDNINFSTCKDKHLNSKFYKDFSNSNDYHIASSFRKRFSTLIDNHYIPYDSLYFISMTTTTHIFNFLFKLLLFVIFYKYELVCVIYWIMMMINIIFVKIIKNVVILEKINVKLNERIKLKLNNMSKIKLIKKSINIFEKKVNIIKCLRIKLVTKVFIG